MGCLMTMLAQDVGFPVPVGGAGQLTAALVARVRAAGAEVVSGQRVERIELSAGRAVGVVTAAGDRVRARRAIVADVSAPDLYRRLLPADAVPASVLSNLTDGACVQDRPWSSRCSARIAGDTTAIG
jgi:phytoene dehydrogenase-like protein